MSNQLCICIPTFNRIDKLRKSLSYHANLCLKYGAGLVVSDNASTDGTRELLTQYKEQYSWFDFVSNHSNIGLMLILIVHLNWVCKQKLSTCGFLVMMILLSQML